MEEFTQEINQATSIVDDTFILISVLEVSLTITLLLIMIIASGILTNKVVKPIMKLTAYAQVVNQTAHAKDETSKLKKKINFDIDELKVIMH